MAVAKISSFLNFKQSFTSNVSSLKRRFSQGDLDSEFDDGEEIRERQQRTVASVSPGSSQPQQPPASSVASSSTTAIQPTSTAAGVQQQQQESGGGFSFAGFRPTSRTTSAPTSPSKSRESFLQRVQSLTAGVTRPDGVSKQGYNKDRCFTLLVVDDQNTDWSKYFRGRQLHVDYDIRVEQAEFSEISVTGSTENGSVVTMVTYRGGNKIAKSFKPHFVLVRQNIRDQPEDYKSALLGLKYGNVPAINSLDVIYNFQDKPWVFGHLLQVQKKVGKNVFPLIGQSYFSNHKEMMNSPKYPSVIKVGHAHSGAGKVRVQNVNDYQDMTSIVAITGSYCTSEPLIEAKYDIHVQKIGSNYKAFMRKSISGSWKTNVGSAMLEQVPISDRYKSWVNAVCQLFGGMDMCSVEALVDREGREYIIELNDSALPLMGDTQEEDRRHIVELVCAKMQYCCRLSNVDDVGTSEAQRPPVPPPRPEEPPKLTSATSVTSPRHSSSDRASDLVRRDSQLSQSSTGGGPQGTPASRPGTATSTTAEGATRRLSGQSQGQGQPRIGRQGSLGQGEPRLGEDGEDTMTNLRKTFAGIFGDM